MLTLRGEMETRVVGTASTTSSAVARVNDKHDALPLTPPEPLEHGMLGGRNDSDAPSHTILYYIISLINDEIIPASDPKQLILL